ncbi:MAG: 3'(2'),5'-bisphosphate nucleotidase CysQ [Candidatus Saccharimonadales bacterium]
MLKDLAFKELLNKVVAIALEAGREVLEIYESDDFKTTYKTDNSPLTRADLAANKMILHGLKDLTPNIAIVSEESLDDVPEKRFSQDYVWLVDPLDGTKEFVNKSPDFTVNIGLVENGQPVLGAVYAPARDLLYYGAKGLGAWKKTGNQKPAEISVQPRRAKPVVAVSHSHVNQQTLEFLKQLGEHEKVDMGSSLKLCFVADGTIDIYPRLAPTMEWDTAAADAVVRAAGGQVLNYETKKPLTYNKPDLHNPFFVVSAIDH